METFTGANMVWWQGVVEDNKDPEALGRLKVRIFGYHTDDKGVLPTERLPWAMPIIPITSASIAGVGISPTGCLPGAWVMGFFRDGADAQDPIIFGSLYGRPNDTSTVSEDGAYPSVDERVPGASTTNEQDVNRLARGTGVDTGEGAVQDAATSETSGHGEQYDKEVNQTGTSSDQENRKRLSKITTKNGRTTYVATVFATQFQGFINELERTPAPNHPNGYTIYSIGGYVYRKSASGTGAWSYHASGAAIDINPRENPYSNQFITDLPSNISTIAKKYGLGWGGDWRSKKDTMHFSMAAGERGSANVKRNGIVPDPLTGSQDAVSQGLSQSISQNYTLPSTIPSQSLIQEVAKPTIEISNWVPNSQYNIGDYVKTGSANSLVNSTGGPPHTLKSGIIASAASLGVSAQDLATAISYETGGTLDPKKVGPTTKWGQHRGLIQFGEPQAAQYGVDFSTKQSAIDTQLGTNGAIVNYLRDAGVQPGMGLLQIYSAINAGGVGEKYYGRSDTAAGGAPGTVLDKVNNQMSGHKVNATRLLQGADANNFLSDTVYVAKQAGTSGNDGGPRDSNLTDGQVLWEQAPQNIQEASFNSQKEAAEAAALQTTDGYSTAAQGGTPAGTTTSDPKPYAVQQKQNTIDETDLFKEPENPYKAEYPYNKVLFTESGHIQEFDDTPGAERIHTYHKSGTFEEIHPNGTKVTKIVKDNYEIVFGDNNIYVKGNLNVVVDKDANIKIGGKVNADISGTLDTKSGGNTTIKAPRIDLNP